jgi:hypothetical protein
MLYLGIDQHARQITVSLRDEGGVVWRYQDADNYYVCRYNPLETNFRVYKVVAGKREQLATAEKIELKSGEWHAFLINHKGEKIFCSLAGK